MLAMDTLSTSTSPLPISPDHTGQHTNTEHLPADLDGPPAGIDRKTKKRIQNRVAQRTYRTRIKQRLHDLQQEVHTLRQKEEEQQRDSLPCETGVSDSDEGMRFYGPFIRDFNTTPTHGKERSNLEVTRQDGPDIKTTDSGPWAGIPGQSNMWTSSVEESGFLYNNTFHMPTRPRLELTGGATTQDLSPPTLPINISTSINYSPTYHREHQRDALEFSSGIEGNLQQPVTNRTNNPYVPVEEGRVTNFQGFGGSPRVSPWGHKVELNTTTDASTPPIAARHTNIPQPILYQDGTTAEPMMPTLTQWPENTFPNPQATLEEKFEYVLSCAQRVGFDSFDTLSYHYYTRNFNPASALALDQRMSRNRRVPELLAELRRQAATWSTWQRRGYEDEMLRAAQEICIMEFNEFRKWEEPESLNETALGDMLPNLGSFLTALVASNPHLSQRQISETVFISMRHLCGLDGTQSQSVTSSRQSPR
ncbi:hypothetical protein GGR51DRAFT_513973 [Nemania sp. FL0031]|nr:hypothetical protein GGR51DRAFT_513973 [Nemania sp. FL0031]